MWELARSSLRSAQNQIKTRHDQKAVSRSFLTEDKVLVLLPMAGSALQVRFTGPYVVKEKLRDTDYVVDTPDHRRKSGICHVNMLKVCVTIANLSKKLSHLSGYAQADVKVY